MLSAARSAAGADPAVDGHLATVQGGRPDPNPYPAAAVEMTVRQLVRERSVIVNGHPLRPDVELRSDDSASVATLDLGADRVASTAVGALVGGTALKAERQVHWGPAAGTGAALQLV